MWAMSDGNIWLQTNSACYQYNNNYTATHDCNIGERGCAYLVCYSLVTFFHGRSCAMPCHSAAKGSDHKQQLLLGHFPPKEEDQAPEKALTDA